MSGFLDRHCPTCGSAEARAEVKARQVAEAMPPETLRAFWSGLFKDKCFFTYHRCGGCGLLYNQSFFDGAALSSLYASMAPNMDAVATDAIAATQRGYFERAASRDTLHGGYLEIGPDVGHIAEEAAKTGDFQHFWLFEPNRAVHPALREAVGERRVTICVDMEDLSAVPDRSIGLAVMVHVLDHLLDPLAMLRQIRAKLRPGGTLMLVTHNEQSLLRSLMGSRWPAFCLQHPQLYNPATIVALLQDAGYCEIGVERSRNHFPIDFLARQAAWAVGMKLAKMPLPSASIGLRLGNILTLAGRSRLGG